ncbi:hypothetical protein PV325_012392 [Microctonus aethiopoides]|nr:hypothetical protein PV325_012392 [Microctonus aethiopoides]
MTGGSFNSIIPHNEADARKSAEEMDEQRHKTLAYEYLCHLEEAKKWIEACIREELPPTTELEENLRNGVYLAKLAHFMDPQLVPLTKIYDIEQKRYAIVGLQFRHTENIFYFLKCLKSMNLPLTFQPETTDIYDKKNMPRVIYCIHALSTHLFKLGKAPQIQDLYGKVNFTDAEIDAVSKELRKYGIEMPAFQKIGGLLTNCMEGDTAALHAAVIAINQSLVSSNALKMLDGLMSPAARLQNVNSLLMRQYMDTLSQAKELKTQAALNRSLNDSYVPDAYDELLTPAEIQGHINSVNARHALEGIIDSLNSSGDKLLDSLKNSVLQLERIVNDNVDAYKAVLKPVMGNVALTNEFMENRKYWQDLLQKKIDQTNYAELQIVKRQEAVRDLNIALNQDSLDLFYEALSNPHLGMFDYIDEFSVPLYYEELKVDYVESKCDLSYADIITGIRVLSSIALVTKAVDTGNPELVYEALKNPQTYVINLDEMNKVKYYRALAAVRSENQINKKKCSLLTYTDIQEAIDLVNQQCQNDDLAINILRKINIAVLTNDSKALMSALNDDLLQLNTQLSFKDGALYLKLFNECLNEKHSDGSELWLDDVKNVVEFIAEEIEIVVNTCTLLVNINKAVRDDDFYRVIEYLCETGLNIDEKYYQKYFELLQSLMEYKDRLYNCSIVRFVTPHGTVAFLDLSTCRYTWDCQEKLSESHFITKDDIIEIVKSVTIDDYNLRISKIDVNSLIEFQAMARGYLLRKKISERLTHFYNNVDKIIKIQAWWRGVLQRNFYIEMMQAKYDKQHEEKDRIAAENPYDYYRQNEDKIIKIQAFWRGRIARRAFLSLLRMEKPPFPVVRHFSTILNFNAEDYDKDLQLQQLKHDVVQAIKRNQQLSQQLDGMDIKIGLLIQNRITLQDVIAHGKHLDTLAKEKSTNRSRKYSFGETMAHKGLKSLTKEGRKMLEGYQHLFYVLQTNPVYLAKLIFLLPQSKTNKFLQNVILTLYNFGSNVREEYLLLKLFGRALQEEIRSKFTKPSEVVTGNPLVLKMVVNYARQLNGQRALRQILGPVIEKVLADKSISIETNPVDIYKCWRNQLEMETGETLDLPYSVTQQQALTYEQVRLRLTKGIKVLQTTVIEFLKRITESRDLIPYGMLYVSKVLRDTLSEKFPDAPEKDILKVVGNLIYYHFINAAIVAPDAFDIITLPIDKSLTNDQRRNLASIAKILQFAASKKGFGEEATHLVCLNPFIIDCHEKFKRFFRSCCEIDELDEHFNIHEYTEATLIHKPEIYISLQEICDTHTLLLEYQYDIATDPLDPLHELLDDLVYAPTIASLMGITEPVCDVTLTRMGKTEVCLVLTNKFEVPEDDDQNLHRLFIKTKELLVSVLQFLKGDTLVSAMESNCSTAQERLYNAKYSSMIHTVNIIQRNSSSFNDCKVQLRAYLQKLELGGWVSKSDGYQSIVTAVAKDLCNKGKYRALRNKELQTLRLTRQRLQEKTKYYAEQVEYYNEYIQRCLENLHTGKGSLNAIKTIEKNNHCNLKSKKPLKYSAAKLSEKGILLEIDGLPQSQFKNVIFEITPTDHTGVFSIKGKFMGVEMEKIDIDIQQLLELQFEGKPIMNLFNKAKINVNLLLYLLNRKFYGKTK